MRYGGTIHAVHGLCRSLVGLGHQVEVYTTNVDGTLDSDVPLQRPVSIDGVDVSYFPSHRLRRLYWAPRMAAALGRRIDGFDLVHLHSVFLWPTLAAARTARDRGVPYLTSPHGMLVGDLIRRRSPWLKRGWLALFERRTLERAAAVHVTSPIEDAELRRMGFRLPRVAMIPNGVDPPRAGAMEQLGQDLKGLLSRRPLILYLGRISWKKGLDTLIQAMVAVPIGHLVIAGNDEEGYVPGLRDLAARAGVAERISFLPRLIEGCEKAFLFEAASVFVLPSHSENFGITVVEAMSRGCPVVVTPEVGAAHWVRAAAAGLVSERSPTALAAAISGVLTDERGARAMGEAGRQCALQAFSWQAVASRMEALYLDLLAQAPPADQSVREPIR